MVEFGLLWTCPYCEKAQSRVIRFPNGKKVSKKDIELRKKEATYKCIYCGKNSRYSRLSSVKSMETSQGKIAGEINKLEFR